MRKLLPFILFLLLIAAVLSAPMILRQDHFRNQLATSLSERLQHKVVIGHLEGGLFPPALKLHDVSLMNPAGDTAILQVEQITALLSWQALFRGALAPQSLDFRGWKASIQRNQDGRWAWEEWLGSATHLGGSTEWPIKVITFDRGECHAVDPYGPGPEEFVIQVQQGGWERDRQYVSINGIFTSLPAPVNFLFQGSGHFISNAQWTGVLGLSDESRQWKLDLKVMSGHTEATGQSEQWRLDTAYAFLRYYSRLPVPPPIVSPAIFLQGWNSHFDWQGNTLSFTQDAAVAGGRSEVKGEVLFKPTAPTAHVDIALQDAKAELLEPVFWGSAPLEGAASGLAHFDLVLSTNTWGRVNGQGALELKAGRYFWPDVSGRSLMKAHTMRYLLKKYPGFLTSGMNYSSARVQWQARGGMFSFDDAFCNLGDIQIALAGKYDAASQGLDAYARVQVHERNADLLKILPPAYVDKGQGAAKIQPMHGHIQGTPGEWHLRAVRSSKIPAATLNKLSKAIHSK